ncbi:MAG: hypothetical protein AAF296_13905 [Pseudomonadota bacterium]
MPETPTETGPEERHSPRGPFGKLRDGIAWLNANKKRFFWWWVLYQAIKGMITLSLIWIPLLLLWMRSN